MLAIEAQERIFYALADNIAINNCFNARAIHAAVTSQTGVLRIPVPDYLSPATFGSLELRPSATNEPIGQAIDYRDDRLAAVPAISIDSLALPRLDLLKIDVEGMELEVLEGASTTIGRCLPIIVVEHLKTHVGTLRETLVSHGYRCFDTAMNIVAVHTSDRTLAHLATPASPAPA